MRPTWARCLFLIVLGVLIRAPALQGEFIWDDTFLAHDNPFIRSPYLIFEVFRHHLMLDSLSAHYRPVQNISYMFDYLFWNTNTYGFHLSNIFWHVGSGVLLFFLLRQILVPLGWKSSVDSDTSIEKRLASDFGPFLLALLWMVHPVHSAAIDYVSGRADSLAFFFSCGAWLLYLRARRSAQRVSKSVLAILAAVSLLLGLCSRESACMWTLIFLTHLFFFEKNLALRSKCLVLAICLSVVGLYAGLRNLPADRAAAGPSNGWSASTQGVLMLRALGDYGRLMIFPSNLHMERTVVNAEAAHGNASWRAAVGADYLTILGMLVAAALIYGSLRPGRARPLRAFGACWFVLTYLPISNLFELNATVAEHWLYLPSVGFLIFLAGCLLEFPVRIQRYGTALACVAVVALSARSYVRSADWVTNETFYRNTVTAGGGSVRVVLNLGQIYANQGKLAMAERMFRKALDLCPTYLIARNNLADVLHREGKVEESDRTYDEAKAAAPEARKDFPRTWVIALAMAKLRADAGDVNGALEILAEGRREYPTTWSLISLESELLRKTQGPDAGIPAVAEFARANWWHLGAQLALGKLYFEKGDIASAEAAFRLANRLDVHGVGGLNMLALLRSNQQRFDEAYRLQTRAIARQPDEPRQYLILSDILGKMGRSQEAHALLAQVTRMETMARAENASN
ncbi:MAG: tetratricopeptide repeat protein [Chthoniobacterales bacterium]